MRIIKNTSLPLRFLITMSRRNSPRTRSFCKDLSNALPLSIKVNRGKMSLKDLHLLSLKSKCDRVLIVSTFKGNPRLITFYSVNDKGLIKLNPQICIVGVKLTFELSNVKKIKPKDIVVYCSEHVSEYAIMLSKLINCRVVYDLDINNLSNNLSIVNINTVENHEKYYTISFTDPFRHFIGPFMKVKFI